MSQGGGWWRPDIEGMRGIGMIMVLLAHSGFTFAEGGYIGLDLFFVISGYLITTLLLREMHKSGTLSIRRFYARRIKRLAPSAALVLIFVVVFSQLLFSAQRNELVAGDVLSAVFYFVNWRLSEQSVDYFAEGFGASPVQHFWSLAVEEQFYIVWPLLLLGVTLWWRSRAGRVNHTAMAVAIGAIVVASLAYSIGYTPGSPGKAYLSTFTRIWEIGLGALMAVVTLPKLRARAAGAFAWAGMIVFIATFFALNEHTPFPGTVAVVPALAIAAILLAGHSESMAAPMRLLASAPIQYIGRISYCWYLWHWPFLIFADAAFGPLTDWEGLIVVSVAWVPTAATHEWIEKPFRRAKILELQPRRAAAVLGVGSGTAATAALALAFFQPGLPVAPASAVEGAAAVERDQGIQRKAEAIRPDPRNAFEDRTLLFENDCFLQLGEVEPGECAYGDTSSSTTVVLFGDSHGEHFFPAMEFIAKKHGWRLVALTKSFCSPADITRMHPSSGEPFAECDQWRESMLERITEEEQPRLVVVGGGDNHQPLRDGKELEGEAAEEALVEGYVSTMERLREGGAQVALMRDIPNAEHDIPECVLESSDDLRECTFPVPDSRGGSIERRAADQVDRAFLVDVTPTMCPDGVCRAVIGDAITYRDRGHITATFSATLAPVIERQLPRVN